MKVIQFNERGEYHYWTCWWLNQVSPRPSWGSCSSPAVNNHHRLDGGDKMCDGGKGVEWVVSMSPGGAS